MKLTPLQQSAILYGAGYVATAIINTAPPKDAVWDWRTLYGWALDAAHLMLNRVPASKP